MISKDLINRQVPFRFAGHDLIFNVSLGLFSSLSIDRGSRLLLKTLAQNSDMDFNRILDVGCGYGTLGLSLAAKIPKSSVLMQDRDHLAAGFSKMNKDLNKIKNAEIFTELAFKGLENEDKFDLVISNIPAKAGQTVLEAWINHSFVHLSDKGICAVVIVDPLSDFLRETIEKSGSEIVFSEKTSQYTVFHYKKPSETDSFTSDTCGIPLESYIRHSGEFTIKIKTYNLETVYNISDFDNPGMLWPLNYDILKKMTPGKNILYWNPGQGHLPVLMLGNIKKEKHIHLAGRDRLQLETTARNLSKTEHEVLLINASQVADISEALAGKEMDFIHWNLEPVSQSKWYATLKDQVLPLLKSGGLFCITGKSRDVQFFTKKSKGLTPLEDKKSKGNRVILYRKNA